MDTYTIPVLRQGILSGSLMFGMPPHAKMQYIATDDIGAIVAVALENPKTFTGKALELAGDELTMAQTVEVFSRVIGRHVQIIEMPVEQVRSFDPNLAKLNEWILKEGFHADIPALRAMYPALMTLEVWLRKTGWEQGA